MASTVADVLQQQQQQQQQQHVDDVSSTVAADLDGEMEGGRIAYFVGDCADGASALNEVLVGLGIAPAIVAAQQASHAGLPLSVIARQLRDVHAGYFELYKPVQVDPHPTGLEDVRVVLNVQMDAGEVPSMSGGYRRDVAGLVVLDGLCTEDERSQVLDWLTAPGHDHQGDPPLERWERTCVDREGDNVTWGLRPEVLSALELDPPAAIVAVQSRLAALYPEYTLAHMPAEHMAHMRTAAAAASAASSRRQRSSSGASGDRTGVGATREESRDVEAEEGTEDDEEGMGEAREPEEEEVEEEEDDGSDAAPLSCFVGNAVRPGDPCAWHLDADPSVLPPSSPWIHNFGYYTNREPGRPLFVSLLLYLNDAWPDEHHAETLFLDPDSQMGVFVRPAPGRVVLMEQDMSHRISAPSLVAPGPRYSLVWKMVFFPRRPAAPAQLAASGATTTGTSAMTSKTDATAAAATAAHAVAAAEAAANASSSTRSASPGVATGGRSASSQAFNSVPPSATSAPAVHVAEKALQPAAAPAPAAAAAAATPAPAAAAATTAAAAVAAAATAAAAAATIKSTAHDSSRISGDTCVASSRDITDDVQGGSSSTAASSRRSGPRYNGDTCFVNSVEGGGEVGGDDMVVTGAPLLESICRHEWGPPLRMGSAWRPGGIPAWQGPSAK